MTTLKILFAIIVIMCGLALIGGMPIGELWEAIKSSALEAGGLLLVINLARLALKFIF